MKKYCLDTSGLSNPLENNPEDIYVSPWLQIRNLISLGYFAATTEILDELKRLPGSIGKCFVENEDKVRMEIGSSDWDWNKYIFYLNQFHTKYENFIRGKGGNKESIGMEDLSIITLAKTLEIPLISMEKLSLYDPKSKKRKIPDICQAENIKHLTFNQFLRAENIVF